MARLLHYPQIFFLAITLTCSALLWHGSMQFDQPQELSDSNKYLTVGSRIRSVTVSRSYPFNPEKAAGEPPAIRRKVSYSCDIPARICYPVPSRPSVAVVETPQAEFVSAVVATVTELNATGTHTAIEVSFKLPQMKYAQPVRAEIFRSEDTSAPSELTPCHSFSLDGQKPDSCSFRDENTQPGKSYSYSVRLIARLVCRAGDSIPPGPHGETRPVLLQAPADAELLSEGQNLYRGRVSPAISARRLPAYEIRFSGIEGAFPPAGTPEEQRGNDYKATFLVKVWVEDLQEMKDLAISAAPGEALAGSVLCYSSKETKVYPFNPGLVMREVKWGETTTERRVHEPVLNSNGTPLIDSAIGQPRMQDRVIRTTHEVQIAVIQDSAGRVFEYPRTASSEKPRLVKRDIIDRNSRR